MPTQGINAKKLLDHMGGITETHAALAAVGVKITPKAVRKWQERNSIPGAHLLRLVEIAKKAGKPIDLLKFRNATTPKK